MTAKAFADPMKACRTGPGLGNREQDTSEHVEGTTISNPVSIIQPQLFPLKVLHRHDGFISFAVKGDYFKPEFCIRADSLDLMFPQFRDRLIRDSFVSLNGAYRHAKGSVGPAGTPWHRIAALRYLCAAYSDIDHYKRGLSFEGAFKGVLDLYADQSLPPASMVIDSGRGMWLLWLLHDESNPARAHLGAWQDNPNDHYQLYAKINVAIFRRLEHLGADPCATDGARYIRMPGSWRNDEERTIRWSIHGEGNSVYSYSLKGLGRLLGVDVSPRLAQEIDALEEPRKKFGNRSKGWNAARKNTLAAFCTLMDLRGGFTKGCRNQAALTYAMLLRLIGATHKDVSDAVDCMAEQCKPPLTAGERQRAVRNCFKHTLCTVGYQKIADWFTVCPQEAEIISQTIGKPFPAAIRFGCWVPATNPFGGEKRDLKQSLRRQEIRRIVAGERGGVPPSFREMKALLFAHGIQASHVTIRSDYQALGYVTLGTMSARALSCSQNSQLRFP